ncbi:hypothetical protein G6F58_013820 [Rhizopus delemar]|nr:hypothetical protein G6F58_013820 [Rhizopus delemar]
MAIPRPGAQGAARRGFDPVRDLRPVRHDGTATPGCRGTRRGASRYPARGRHRQASGAGPLGAAVARADGRQG